MSQTLPDTEIITLDLPVPVYLEALRAARELGFPSLHGYATHLIDQLIEEAGPPPDDSGG